jgi:predicted RecA/RadA family phage recombinase
MAEYAPIYFSADRIPVTTSAAVTAGQLLYVSGNDTVAKTSAATGAWLGVAAHDAGSGIHELAASGAIAAGARVCAAANGAVADFASGTDYSQVVGIALSAADNSKVRVYLRA